MQQELHREQLGEGAGKRRAAEAGRVGPALCWWCLQAQQGEGVQQQGGQLVRCAAADLGTAKGLAGTGVGVDRTAGAGEQAQRLAQQAEKSGSGAQQWKVGLHLAWRLQAQPWQGSKRRSGG